MDTLGNLTLTGYNSELGDRPFEEKKTLPIKAGDTATSDVPKGYTFSRLLMTQQIAQETHWDEAEHSEPHRSLGPACPGTLAAARLHLC